MASTMPRGLRLLEETVVGATWTGRVLVEPECPLLDGHFPGRPVLPGIAQLDIALAGASALAGRRLVLTSIETFALQRVVGPGDVLDARLENGGGPLHRFEMRCAGVLTARGVVAAE